MLNTLSTPYVIIILSRWHADFRRNVNNIKKLGQNLDKHRKRISVKITGIPFLVHFLYELHRYRNLPRSAILPHPSMEEADFRRGLRTRLPQQESS